MKYFFFGVFIFCKLAAIGQYETNHLKRDLVNLKADFTNLINPQDPSLLLSVEYYVHPAISLNHEFGYVLDIVTEDEGDAFQGFKTRHEFRWYFTQGEDPSDRFYTSVNFQYRYLAVDDRYTLGYECDSGGCEYLKNFMGKIQTDRYVVQFRLGLQSHLTRRLILECDAGIGVQYYDVRRSSIHNGRFMESNRLFSEEDFGRKPYLSISGKLGYVLFKK